jgi:hypothetical protein
VEIDGTLNIGQLKAAIESKTDILAANQKLLWKGSILKDDTAVSSLNLSPVYWCKQIL